MKQIAATTQREHAQFYPDYVQAFEDDDGGFVITTRSMTVNGKPVPVPVLSDVRLTRVEFDELFRGMFQRIMEDDA